jgi:hypothetical protein
MQGAGGTSTRAARERGAADPRGSLLRAASKVLPASAELPPVLGMNRVIEPSARDLFGWLSCGVNECPIAAVLALTGHFSISQGLNDWSGTGPARSHVPARQIHGSTPGRGRTDTGDPFRGPASSFGLRGHCDDTPRRSMTPDTAINAGRFKANVAFLIRAKFSSRYKE